jgi:hypothetical protein
MARFFTRERFGNPQLIALFLLLAFLAQCLWLISRTPISDNEAARIRKGLLQWRKGEVAAADPEHSPLYFLIGSVGLVAFDGATDPASLDRWRWLARAPWVALGLMLAASLWYVARRLYGNLGGYIALVLFCFAPTMVGQSASYFSPPEMGSAWGVFGAVFTAIAVAHTLYAPRRVLWNWWRISLLALSLALAIGCQFTMWILLPLGLALMLYLAPERRRAALGIYAASCGMAAAVLVAAYFFEPRLLREGLAQARFLEFAPRALAALEPYSTFLVRLTRSSPALLVLLPLACVTFAAWPRARYFGNAAPLVVAAVLIGLGLMSGHETGLAFEIAAMPILFVFIAGVFADLLETRHREVLIATTAGILAAHALWSLASRGGLLSAATRSPRVQ